MSSPRSSRTPWSAGSLLRPMREDFMRRLLTALSLSAALAFAACNTGPNPSEDVLKALKAANLNDVVVEWDSAARIAHLKGTVDRPADRQRANEIATATVGTTG